MSLHAEFDRLSQILTTAEVAGRSARRDLIANEIIECGGTYTPAKPNLSHVFEISLHGVSATGFDEDEAISNWIKNASRQRRGMTDPATLAHAPCIT